MKTKFNLLLASVILLTWLNASAQTSYLKFGASINSAYIKPRNGKDERSNYPSLEASYERSLGKKWSVGLGFNYSVRHSEYHSIWDFNYTKYDKMFILDGRYYFYSTGKGLFLQLGASVFSSKQVDVVDDGNKLTTYTHNRTGANFYGGLGLKYPITPKWGIEITVNATPDIHAIENYGTGGYIRSGIKLSYALGKRKSK